MSFAPYGYTSSSEEGELVYDKVADEFLVTVTILYKLKESDVKRCKEDLENQKSAIQKLDKNVLIQEKDKDIQSVQVVLDAKNQ